MRQYLIIDADDTLWENNIYFERAFDEFVEFLDHSLLARARCAMCWTRSKWPTPAFMATVR